MLESLGLGFRHEVGQHEWREAVSRCSTRVELLLQEVSWKAV